MVVPLRSGVTVTLWAAPDLAYWSPDEATSLVLVDWKTGGAEDAEQQLAAYALYVTQRNAPPTSTRMVGRIVSLSPYREEEIEITARHLADARDRIEADIALMRTYQADPSTNEPVSLHEFEMPPEEHRRQCTWCPYHLLCEPLQRVVAEEACPPSRGELAEEPSAPADCDFGDLFAWAD